MQKKITLITLVFALLVAYTLPAQDDLQFIVNAPGDIEGQLADVGPPAAGFGGNLMPGEFVTGDLAWIYGLNEDGNVDSMACDSVITNVPDVTGKVALIRRGGCFFSDKVYFAQNAGAIAAVVCNHTPGGGAIVMGSGGTYAGLAEIPSAFISYEDCETILMSMAAGNTVNITLRVPTLYSAWGAYSYHTPATQILPIDEIQVNTANDTGVDQPGVEFTVVVTNPDGDVTTLTEFRDLATDAIDTVAFEQDYTPAGLGEYTMVYTSSLSQDVIEKTFVITEDLFALDNNEIVADQFGLTPVVEDYIGAGRTYGMGSFYLTGDSAQLATLGTFGIANPDSIPDGDVFNLRLYDADPDGDGEVPGTITLEDMDVIAFAEYIKDASLQPNELITLELQELGDDLVMKANGQYLLMVLYNGTQSMNDKPPSFTGAGSESYPYYGSMVLTDQLYTGGWTSGSNAVVRLTVEDPIIDATVEPLSDNKVHVFPSPADAQVSLELNLNEVADKVQVRIANLQGRTVASHVFEQVQRDATYQFDISQYPNGTYFLSISTPEGYKAKKFTVAH